MATPTTAGPMDTDAMDSDVVSNQVSGATSALATADAVAPPMLEQRVELLLTELEQLVPLLPEAAMAAILVRVRAMAASASSCEEVAGHDGSPLRPEQLSYANAANVLVLTAVREDDARSEAGSIGSVGEAATSTAPTSPLDPNYLRHEDTSADDPRADLNGWGDLDIDFVGWQPPNAAAGGFDIAMNSAADGAIGMHDPTTRERRGQSERDDLGLGANGRVMYCDFHDHRCGDANACMAVDMLQQRDIAALVERHRKVRRDKPRDDLDGRKARHALYKAVVAWQWANPLGAENRVRLPTCVLHRVRRLFPNPCCVVGGDDSCDFLVKCERAGHYTGFRTAEESRAVREGRFVCQDCR